MFKHPFFSPFTEDHEGELDEFEKNEDDDLGLNPDEIEDVDPEDFDDEDEDFDDEDLD